MDRRHLLVFSGSPFAGAIAGCALTPSAAESDPSESATPGSDPDVGDERLRELVDRGGNLDPAGWNRPT